MPMFVLMTKLGPEVMRDPRGRRAAGKAWKKKVEQMCPDIKWHSHYALLGPYDFMDIYEAPDSATAFKVSLISRAEGAKTAESWQAMPYEQFLPTFEKLAEDAGES